MARDLWLTRRLTPTVGKLPKFITLPAGSFICGRPPNSLEFLSTFAFKSGSGIVNAVTTAGTIEAWIYPEGGGAFGFTNNRIIFGEFNTGGSTPRFALSLKYTTNELQGIFDANFVDSGVMITAFEWHHVAISWDGTNARFFHNGEFVATVPYAGPVTAGTTRIVNGLGSAATFPFFGFIGNLRVWNRALSDAEIIYKFNKRRGTPTIDSGLTSYFDCQETGAAILSMADLVDTAHPMTDSHVRSNDTENVPPIIFGASFIAAQWPVSLSNNVSLVWPIDPPAGITGQLCVSWMDDDGVFQRRKLHTVAGVDIAPELASYAGERLATSFTLEFWNIDGAGTVVLPSDFNVGISLTTNPALSYDVTNIAEATATVDTTLAETYPSATPITFETQQTY